MRKIVSLFIIFLCFPVSLFANTGENVLSGALEKVVPVALVSNTVSSQNSGIFSLLDKSNAENLKISETQASIDYETGIQKGLQTQIEELQLLFSQGQKLGALLVPENGSGSVMIPEYSLEDFKTFFAGYKKYFSPEKNLEESPEVFQKNSTALLLNIQTKKQELEKLLHESEQKSEQYTVDLQELENQLEKTQLSIQLQVLEA